MTAGTLIRTALLMAMVAAVEVIAMNRAPAAGRPFSLVSGDATARAVTLGIDKSVVINLPRDVKDVLVADPAIANAVVRSRRRAYIIGVKIGQTNVFFFDADGKQIAAFNIAVTRNLAGLRAALKRAFPAANVTAEGIGHGVELSGNVTTALEAQKAFNLAAGFVDSKDKVVNDITVHQGDEVMLKVMVAEMDRTVIKQLGINLNGSFGAVKINTANPFSVNGSLSSTNPFGSTGSTILGSAACSIAPCVPPYSPAGITGTFGSVSANLQAMEQDGLVRSLASPTLTAISGESAVFKAGGSFPEPSISCNGTTCSPSVQQQSFGVSLAFTPVVLSEGRISLHVRTEVSEIDTANSVTVSGISVPGLSVRSARTTLEIPSGGTVAMAGMIDDETKQTISGIPGAMNLPVLGVLFKSRDYLNDKTELVILVTPYIVRAVAAKDLSLPTDGYADPSDPAAVLLGNLNRIYGVNPGIPPSLPFNGPIGFILD